MDLIEKGPQIQLWLQSELSLYAPKAPDTTICTTQRLLKTKVRGTGVTDFASKTQVRRQKKRKRGVEKEGEKTWGLPSWRGKKQFME